MKNKELETLEKLKEERKLNKQTKQKIAKKALKNFLFATGILLLFTILRLMAINFEKQLASLIYKEVSIGLFIVTLFLFEMAYKRNDDSLAITSIEMFFLSIVTLLTPYILISRASIYTSIIGVYFAVYYAIKIFIIYRKEKNEYFSEKNDISEIVKKESKDKLAQEQLEKIGKEEIKEEPKKRGRGRPRKTTTETNKTAEKTTKTAKTATKKTTKVTEKVEEIQTEEPPKRKRGRPRKSEPEIKNKN